MKKFIPAVEQLQKDVTAIFIDEDMDYHETHVRLVYHLNPKEPGNKKDLTYDECIRKYRAHIEIWNKRNKEKENRGYLAKSEALKRKNFLDFLDLRLYLIDWDSYSTNPLRDDYLFGTLLSQPEMLKQLTDFKKIWQKNQKNED